MKLNGHILKRSIVATSIVTIIFFGFFKIQNYFSDIKNRRNCFPFSPVSQDPTKTTKIEITDSSLLWLQKGGAINDASCLNLTKITGVIQIQNVDDIKNGLFFAKKNNLKISIAGAKHSMGGQAFFNNAVVLDINKFNKISVDAENKVLTAQSGATWHDIQKVIDPYGLAVKSMQSEDIFTVGGSISVNAHGMDHKSGSIGSTIKSMRIMLANGSIQTISRDSQSDLFKLVIGGYGLFGIIIDADFELTDNSVLEKSVEVINYKDFPKIFEEKIYNNSDYELMHGYLSNAPGSFMDELLLFTYKKNHASKQAAALADTYNNELASFIFKQEKYSSWAKELGWFGQKFIEPVMNLSVKKGITRNQAMHNPIYSESALRGHTNILQEYFIPKDQFVNFIDESKKILSKNKTNVLNIEVRFVNANDNILNYSKEGMFSVVIFLNQKINTQEAEKTTKITQDFISLSLKYGGSFYLPYQQIYTKEQLLQAYPQSQMFFEEKKKYDPNLTFMNSFYQKYAENKISP